ncbi:MAG: polyprenyl synthetase family protein [Myxococcota bacterium]
MTLDAWAGPRLAAFEEALAAQLLDAWPPKLGEACRYPLSTGGKRIRPLLAYAAAEAVAGDWRVATPAALAIELVHTYSLVHDDLPCMDDDDERRGRPTVHVVYGEGVAVLVGDALLTEAFAVVPPALAGDLARAAGARGMIAGQAMDVGMGGPVADRATLEKLHAAKTGALIRCAVRIGARSAGASDPVLAALDAYARAVGLAFQVWDDVLDADQDAGDTGPPSYVRLLGVDGAGSYARQLADEALAALAHLPGDATALRLIAEFTVRRTL